MRQRKVTRIVRGRNAVDGAGVRLRRILGDRTIQDFDPFLMLDGFDSTNPQDYIKGFPWHPHRGIETVTYLVSGTMAHEDSLGNKGVIRSMGCQWMTAGSGILHQEMPQPSERLLGCQLWVNLPATKKMVPPTYRDISLTDIPVVADKATVRILSGCYQGIRGALNGSHARVTYLDITFLPAFYGATRRPTIMRHYLSIYWKARLSPIRNNGRSRIRGAPYYIPFPLLEKGHMSPWL